MVRIKITVYKALCVWYIIQAIYVLTLIVIILRGMTEVTATFYDSRHRCVRSDSCNFPGGLVAWGREAEQKEGRPSSSMKSLSRWVITPWGHSTAGFLLHEKVLIGRENSVRLLKATSGDVLDLLSLCCFQGSHVSWLHLVAHPKVCAFSEPLLTLVPVNLLWPGRVLALS